MQLARFLTEQHEPIYGQIVGERLARPLHGDLFGAHTFGETAVRIAKFLAPVEPANIFAIGRNYAAHVAETGAERPADPLVFMKPTTAVAPPNGVIILPRSAPEQVDFEAELAVVIGRACRDVSPEHALDYVFGYTAANDVTARDCQKNDKQWVRAKGFDTFCPLGPVLVTADEFDPHDVQIQSRLNGELMQDASTNAMLFNVPELISYLSHQFTLRPGTLLLTGTPEGVGFVRQPPVFLRDGDEIEVFVAGIGRLANCVFSSTNRA
jgi:2-keto-4-pentenoate hydratase/2-oxohepta-3-ene-1,7-dioic acid hydratase in catechol pathway